MSSGRHGQVSSTSWPPFSLLRHTTSKSSAVGLSARRRTGLEAFEDAGQIVGAPTVTQNQCNSDRLGISARRESVGMFAEEGLDAFVDIELLDQELQQAGRPAKAFRSVGRRTEGFRPDIAAPT